ncbi:Choline/ethanolamine kinase [Halotydeus destructor]|nr:Choline/ethanolamine kinase [Halotydeus destructor]
MADNNEILESDYDRAKCFCRDYLAGNWRQVDLIVTEPLDGGNCNLLIKCSLTEEYQDDKSKPWHVIVRTFTDMNPLKTAGEAAEAVAFKSLADLGIGPKLLGLFPGGRIEEFIDGHEMTVAETRDRDALAALAKCLAKLHSVQVPLNRDRELGSRRYREYIESNLELVSSIEVDRYSREGQDKLRTLLQVDLLSEYDWMRDLIRELPKSSCVFSHGDFYASNVMVKNIRDSDKVTEADIVIIDLEMIGHDDRRSDIAFFLNETSYDFSDSSFPQYIGQLDEELEVHFLEAYLAEWARLEPSKFDAEVDNVDCLMVEQRVYGQLATIVYLAWAIGMLASGDIMADDPIMDYFLDRIQVERVRKDWVHTALGIV